MKGNPNLDVMAFDPSGMAFKFETQELS